LCNHRQIRGAITQYYQWTECTPIGLPSAAVVAHQIIVASADMLLDRHLVVSRIASCMQVLGLLNLFLFLF
jgi:hypothetical protein